MGAALAWADMVARASLRMARTGMLAARMLLTVRKALPWWLAALLIIGCIQVPFLPTDELALAAALLILWFRYRPLLRVCWCAAQLEN